MAGVLLCSQHAEAQRAQLLAAEAERRTARLAEIRNKPLPRRAVPVPQPTGPTPRMIREKETLSALRSRVAEGTETAYPPREITRRKRKRKQR